MTETSDVVRIVKNGKPTRKPQISGFKKVMIHSTRVPLGYQRSLAQKWQHTS